MKIEAIDPKTPPEVLAYGMARYSRSALSFAESLALIDEEKAAGFIQKNYHAYGHASIADMAHVALSVEGVSLVAAMEIVDEPLWDGQERSTRYQDFSAGAVQTPPEMNDDQRARYLGATDDLFDAYREATERLLGRFRLFLPDAPEATLRARTFDVARGLLPLGTLTSLGQITSARTLARQASRLMSSELLEVRYAGVAMGDAGADVAPTLLRHVGPSPYQIGLRTAAERVASGLSRISYDTEPGVSYYYVAHSSAVEMVRTLLWRRCGLGWREVSCEGAVARMLLAAVADRPAYEDLPREARGGYGHVWQFVGDVGSYRDFHRHRRCVQFAQTPTPSLGYAAASTTLGLMLGEGGMDADLSEIAGRIDLAVEAAHKAYRKLIGMGTPASAAQYVLPLATNRRWVMKMDAAEAAYIIELRTKPGGHPLYRSLAAQMYARLEDADRDLARLIRPTAIEPMADLVKR